MINENLLIQKEQFGHYYNEKILPQLEKQEKKRKKMLSIFFLILPLVIYWFAYVLSKMAENSDDGIGAFEGCVSCLIILLIFLPMAGYYKENKESLLQLIIGFWGDFAYEYKKEASEQLLNRSKIMAKHDRFETDDCFFGVYDNIAVTITEYFLYQKHHIEKNNRQEITYKKSGQGILFSAKMNKKFTGQTLIVKDKGFLNKFTHYTGLERVGIESPDFEKKYEVYSDNQIEARYLLTPLMIEYILEVQKIFPKISYSLFDETIFINIETSKNLFECSSFFRTLINQKRIEKNFTELYYIFAIINILHLNQN